MDGTKTLNQLEGEDPGEPAFDSYLLATVHRLRGKPVADFSVEDLRIMLGQEIGVEHLMPSALGHLEDDPLISGDFYRGDLLSAVLSVDRNYWKTHPADAGRIAAIVERAELLLNGRDQINSIYDHLRQLLVAQPWSAT